MAHRKCRAIMGCTEKQYKKVLKRCGQVKDGYYHRTDLYPNPDIDETTYVNQYNKASAAQVAMRNGGTQTTTKRNTEVGKLFAMTRFTILADVNKLYEGNKEKLMASGLGVSKEPSPKAIPDNPSIKRIVDANQGVVYGAKIILIKKTNPLDQNKERVTYIVQMSKERDNEDAWKTVLEIMNMHKLIVQGLIRGEEVFFRVARINAKGRSGWSEPRDFIPR